MPSSQSKQSNQQPFLKRRTFEQGQAQADAAHVATHRLYCDVLKFWRGCKNRACRRHRRCCGEPAGCLMRNLAFVRPSARLKAQAEVIAGGPRRLLPATHIEWQVRRTALQNLIAWGIGSRLPQLSPPDAAGR